MPLTKKPMRYAHPDGHTDVCYYSGEKRGFITCGSDGDVRYWLNLMDDDPATSCISDQSICVISKNGKVFVGNDNNTVQILNCPDLEKESIVTRFSAAVSALATTRCSKLIVSGSCDMRIQVTNTTTSDNIELAGHDAPILSLSLDPKEEFVASSSADGSIRVWSIKEKRAIHSWRSIVPKCNSLLTAKSYCSPSFNCKDGSMLAYPTNKDVVVVERNTWKELFRLKCTNLKNELSICKFSECGSRIAASSLYGEVVVWDVETKEVIGYIEHQSKAKITGLAWSIDEPNEIAFCDSSGQLGCIDVISDEKETASKSNGVTVDGTDKNMLLDLGDNDDDDDDGENVISLNKIKASVDLSDDNKSQSDAASEQHDGKTFMPEANLQPAFQPGSSPSHLLSRFMMWNDTGMVKSFTSEDGEESSIDVEFHDATVHRGIHINNYLKHNIAALSPHALALSCPAYEDTPSKLVVISLQGWGAGNKEWTIDLPEDEEGQCLAAGDNFVAIATSRGNLRIYTVCGTQREIIALPGPVVAMNGLANYLVVAYHDGVGATGYQRMSLMHLQIRGSRLRNQTLNLPLSSSSDLMWLGISDLGSPSTMDADDVLRVYDKKSGLWMVVSDLSRQTKGKADHYFLIGVSESQSSIRCVLCKGSHYPPTTPRPIIVEVQLSVPLCEPDSEKSEKEAKLWQLGSNPSEENEIVLSLIALACRNNVEYRAVELCEQLASDKVLDLAMKYAARINRRALLKKLESIAEIKDKDKDKLEENQENDDKTNGTNITSIHDAPTEDESDGPLLAKSIRKASTIEIKPLSMNETIPLRRSNPFLKSANTSKGIPGIQSISQSSEILTPPKYTSMESNLHNSGKKETFVSWYAKNKKDLQEEFPHLNSTDLTKNALARFKEQTAVSTPDNIESKKRKLSSPPTDEKKEAKRSSTKLTDFAFEKM